jgi:hypothetical protein
MILEPRITQSKYKWNTGWMAGVQFLAGQESFLCPSVGASSGAHNASYTMGTGGSSHGGGISG